MRTFRILLAVCSIASMFVIEACSSAKFASKMTATIDLKCNAVPSYSFNDLTRGLTIMTTTDVSDRNIVDVSEGNKTNRSYWENVNLVVDPSIRTFVNNSLTSYARQMGISVGRDPANDYTLRVNVKDFRFVFGADKSYRAIVELNYTLNDKDNKVLLQQSARGRYTTSEKNTIIAHALEKAYSEALGKIDWVGIASYLKINARPDQEQQRRVVGDGTTALEHTIIRWFIDSRPAGSDVSWRVVSSTPEVKNTNSTYVGTTPYETTEAFDIRGMTFENSGNIQIEVKCEKPGYLPQTKRFNLRQAIEQKEISAKFNLVKEEE